MLGPILITGCSTGIGRALARAFGQRGRRVIATARRAEALADIGPGIETDTLDVTDPASIAALAERLSGAGISMLVNNAGYGAMGPLAELPVDELRRQFETNVIGLHAVTRAFLPAMIAARAGTIVNIASVVGVVATPFAGAYCASKFAVVGLSDCLRMELAPFGVRVVTVQPGAVRSEFGRTGSTVAQRHAVDDGPYARFRQAIALRAVASQRFAMPAESFADRMVDAVLRDPPPAVVRIGPFSRTLPLMERTLPRAALDRILSRRFGLHRLT